MEARISAGQFWEEEEIRMAEDLLQVQETVSVGVRLADQVDGLVPGPVRILRVKELNHLSPGIRNDMSELRQNEVSASQQSVFTATYSHDLRCVFTGGKGSWHECQ